MATFSQLFGSSMLIKATCVLAVWGLLVSASQVNAQREGSRSRERGGERRDDESRGSRGGPSGFRGRFGSGEGGFSFGRGGFSRGGFGRGGSGGFSPADMLRRFDSNGNGTLEPSESQGRARFILDRMVGSIPGVDLSRPIPIDRLARAIERARGGSGESGRGRSSSGSESAVPSLVPGFGLEEELAPPLGFGAEGEKFSVKVTDEDRNEAEERFRRYDSNQDGVLTSNELRRGRWSGDPLTYDRNSDGKLTLSELAIRYAQRRIQRGDDSGGDGTSDEDQARRERFSRFAARFGGFRGRGGDGESSGRSSSRGGFGGFGFRGRGDGARQSEEQDQEADEEQPAASNRSDLKSYRVKTIEERLPGGLPAWFSRNDLNKDGQIAMAEYASSWSQSTVQDFGQFDLNGDRFVTASECLKAVENGAIRGSTSGPSRIGPSRGGTVTATRARTMTSSQTEGGATPGVSAAALKYWRGLVNKYDKNEDGALTPNEWQAMSKSPAHADANGDGRVTPEELASVKR